MTIRALWVLPCFFIALSTGRSDPPQLRVVTPNAVAPGKSVEIELHGERLQGVHRLWSDLEITAERVDASEDGKRARFRVSAPEDVTVTIGGLRAVSTEGVSNLRLFMIDDLETVAEAGDHRERARAQELSPPVAVDGSTDGNTFDWFRFPARAGQRFSVEVLAERLGSPLDPVLRILDEDDRELAFSDDEPGTGSDSRVSFTVQRDGAVFVELRDVTYRGGFEQRYRLRVGDFPLVTCPYPLAVHGSGPTRVAVAGHHVGDVPPAMIESGPERVGAALPVAVRFNSAQGSAFTTVLTSDLEEALEIEPNDSPETACPLSLPGAINGRFHTKEDRDHYRFDVSAGERWTFRGVTRSMGSPSDLWMSLLKIDGSRLAEVEDTGAEEGVLDRTFGEAGAYVLFVEDLHRRGGPEHAYRIECRRFRPGFELEMEREWHNAPQHGVFSAKVFCERREWDGPIELGVVGDGFERLGGEIPKGQKEGIVRIRVPASLEPGSAVDVAITGRARIGDEDVDARADTLVALRKEFPRTPRPPHSLRAVVTVGIGPPFPPFIALDEPRGPIVVPRGVEGSRVAVRIRRLDGGFKDPISLRVDGLPVGLAVDDPRIEKDRSDALLTVRAAPDCALGDHSVRVLAEGVFRDQPQTAALDAVVVRVIEPLRLSVAAAVDLKPGERVRLPVEVRRLGGLNGAATVEWIEVPSSLETTPAELAADASQVELELGAKGDAAPGSYHEVRFAVTLEAGDRNVRVESTSILVHVIAP